MIEELILVVSFIFFFASLLVSLDARIQVKKEEELLQEIISQKQEYEDVVKRYEKLKQELGYSQDKNN